MPKFSLGGLIAGAGQGMTDVGKSMTTVGAALGLEQHREAAQALRAERLRDMTVTENALTRAATAKEKALDRDMTKLHHGQTLATAERSTAASLLKNATDTLKMAKVDYATDPSNPQYITALKGAENDYRDALTTMKSRLSAAGGKAETPKPGDGKAKDFSHLPGMPRAGEKRDWNAFAPWAKASGPTDTVAPAPKTGPGLINQDAKLPEFDRGELLRMTNFGPLTPKGVAQKAAMLGNKHAIAYLKKYAAARSEDQDETDRQRAYGGGLIAP